MFVSSNKLVDILPYFRRKLKKVYDPSELENIFFLCIQHYFNISKTRFSECDKLLSESELLLFRDIVERLEKHEPVQYILGRAWFYDMYLNVDVNTLIPRPETEELADLICKKYKNHHNLTILDIGTGSGCIALALKKNLDANVTAIDISEQALHIARLNGEEQKMDIRFLTCDILIDFPNDLTGINIIVSNPPYIPEKDKQSMDLRVKSFEPSSALFVSDFDPLVFYRRILSLGKKILATGGEIYFEINPAGENGITVLAMDLGYNSVKSLKDISGNTRFIIIS